MRSVSLPNTRYKISGPFTAEKLERQSLQMGVRIVAKVGTDLFTGG